jgi:hypothetical protein
MCRARRGYCSSARFTRYSPELRPDDVKWGFPVTERLIYSGDVSGVRSASAQ